MSAHDHPVTGRGAAGGPPPPDIDAIRRSLEGLHGRDFWRSLEQLAGTGAVQAYVAQALDPAALVAGAPPPAASEAHGGGLAARGGAGPDDGSARVGARGGVSRREFLGLMTASLALAGMPVLQGCFSPPARTIVPYVTPPDGLVPGRPLFYATAVDVGGFGSGVLVESHMGRPTKIEGNPQHPASLGATDALMQAWVLGLYDPDRAQVITSAGRIHPWEDLLDVLDGAMKAQRAMGGAGLRILTGTVTSPTLGHEIRELLASLPKARWHQHEPVDRDCVKAGAQLSFGRIVDTRYLLDKADVVVSLDADFLAWRPDGVRYARDFMDRRLMRNGQSTMNRLYAVETMPTITGSLADHRWPMRPRMIEALACAMAQRVGVAVPGAPAGPAISIDDESLAAMMDDLTAARGAGVVVAGPEQPPAVHAWVHAINHALGNVGRTVIYTDPVEAQPMLQGQSLVELASEMKEGKVDLLVILGCNPAYTAPADLDFARMLANVPLSVKLGLYEDETAECVDWHVPETHPLESWGDTRSPDGTVTIVQPLIAPLYSGKSAIELVAALAGRRDAVPHDVVHDYWKAVTPGGGFETLWTHALHDGIVPGTQAAVQSPTIAQGVALPPAPASPAGSGDTLEIVFRADPTIHDGRFANSGWLQELPKPITKLTWDNAILISPRTAQRLSLASSDTVEVRYQGRSVRAPVRIVPGHADDCVTAHLGYGRTRAGRVGTGAGFNAYALRTSRAPWTGSGVTLHKTGDRWPLAVTHDHFAMEGRDLVRVVRGPGRGHPSLTGAPASRASSEGADATGDGGDRMAPSLYAPHPYEGYKWAMAINLAACIGCNACVVACQAENNIPIVGKDQVIRGREMHWLRIDQYYRGGLDNPETFHQPVACMHCEDAPCEVVCPVGATVHSDEGLNEMVYNRCVGTRYCANNCPYKVRRFNYLQFSDEDTPSLKMLYNPDVTVRPRGVMEKCTYCVQRIDTARIQAKKEDRSIRDGEVRTACQMSCPTQAIAFGDLNDAGSEVARLKGKKDDYALLGDLNTRPRTTYLSKLQNPNLRIVSRSRADQGD